MRPAARHGGVRMRMDFLKRNENQAGMGDRAGHNGSGGTPGALGYPGPCRGAVNKLDVFNGPFKMPAWIPAFLKRSWTFCLVFLCFPIFHTAKRRRSAVGPNVADGVKKLKMSFLTPSFFFGQGVWGLTAKEKEGVEKRREKREERRGQNVTLRRLCRFRCGCEPSPRRKWERALRLCGFLQKNEKILPSPLDKRKETCYNANS